MTDIAVAVASHARPVRLLWLLNALEEQTLPRERWEVVVAHDSGPASHTERVLAGHPLAAAGVLRHVTLSRPGGPAELRNAAWRATTAPLIAFTDDDCRPPPEWLERALAAARSAPGAVVQGTTRPDPDETGLLRAARVRTMWVDPPAWQAQTCNIVYPRAAVERAGGFDERDLPLCAGEDTDLFCRTGAPLVAAPGVLTYHAVEPMSVVARVRFAWRWRQLPALVARHPELRRHAELGVFWKRRHARFLLALAGLAARRPALALPWALAALPSYGPGVRGRVRAVSELPGQALVDAVEVAALAQGSARHRTLFL
ncbi:MAG TPA: glycosyltransferase [Solirubrobacteraceae bacterium]|nr:glycosyltransferase [Solirubrobacteraceae bacterium]